MCSGKVYFDLLAERDAREIDDIYLMRLEQIYPVPKQVPHRGTGTLPAGRGGVVPGRAAESGAWSFIAPNLERLLTGVGARHPRPRYAGRPESASPATGLASKHKAEQAALVDAALTIEGN